jgi:hypothetical protein
MKDSRIDPESPTIRAPMDAATAAHVTRPRRALRLRTGLHRGIGRQQVPSGIGPASHGPPQSGGRVQTHVPFASPGLRMSRGVHSVVARHSPVGLGPIRHGHPSAAFPQTQVRFGRS